MSFMILSLLTLEYHFERYPSYKVVYLAGTVSIANLLANRKLKKRIMLVFRLFLDKFERIANSKSDS